MKNKRSYVIDFDSTFTQVEALEVLGEISLANEHDRHEKLAQLEDITNQGMEGTLSFRESLIRRLEILNAEEKHLPHLVAVLKKKISTSFVRNEAFFQENREDIYIISNGFKEFIIPIVKELGIKEEHVFANTFKFDENGKITGFDENNVLSINGGKVATLKTLDLQGDVYMIGDGYTDYEVKAAGLANKFYAFTENIERDSILEKADHITPSMDEFLYLFKMNKAISYPKNRIKVLLLENVHPDAIGLMKQEGYNVVTHTG
ncbi:MAG TPA: HAD-IB family phosphatase, partial [Gillisia sp.]|nr:HAD-IB family phosphatase [Gillisia sp.]